MNEEKPNLVLWRLESCRRKGYLHGNVGFHVLLREETKEKSVTDTAVRQFDSSMTKTAPRDLDWSLTCMGQVKLCLVLMGCSRAGCHVMPEAGIGKAKMSNSAAIRAAAISSRGLLALRPGHKIRY